MTQYKYIIETVEGAIGRMVLNRPERHNALNIEMIRELSESIHHLNKIASIRLIKIEARGTNFSAGADLNWMKEGLNQSEDELLAESEELASLFNDIYNSSKITLVSAKGKIMGGANGILAAADIVLASENTSMMYTEARLGLIPATIAPYVVQKVGKSVAMEWMLSGRLIDSEEAWQRGLLNRIFIGENDESITDKYIDSLLGNGPEALKGIKSIFREVGMFQNPDDQIKESAKLIAKFRVSNEGQEGMRAFLKNASPIGAMNKKNLNKILIANRGEIALRIIESIRKSGRLSVVVYADNDKDLPFVSSADEAWPLGSGPLQETYLNQEKIIQIALNSKADAIHPGYGFLSENAEFAKECAANKITFIGPSAEVIDLMGNKSNAREHAKKLGVPVLDGLTGSKEYILEHQEELEYPILIKPSGGGGGKGMHIVHKKEALSLALNDAGREAISYFNSDQLYLERYLEKARHIEVQMLADHHGNLVHLFERECTLQRRHQKIIEEAPAVSISPQTRKKIIESALTLSKKINYTNAGTIEFLVDKNEDYFFIEMNTRIQVEHPVTESITGVDIVSEQLNIANNAPLSFKQEDVKISGHSIEARIYAENPAHDFIPSAGIIKSIKSNFVKTRIDAAYASGNTLSSSYDPMVAKIISHGNTREEAREKLAEAIMEYHVSGISTNREFLLALLASNEFLKNTIYTRFIDDNLDRLKKYMSDQGSLIVADTVLAIFSILTLNHKFETKTSRSIWEEIGHWRHIPEIEIEMNSETFTIHYEKFPGDNSYCFLINDSRIKAELKSHAENNFTFEIDGTLINCWAFIDHSEIVLDIKQHTFTGKRTDIPDQKYIRNSSSGNLNLNGNEIVAPLNGKIVQVNFTENDMIKKGDTLLVIESMKMENKIIAPNDGQIEKQNVKVGALVELNEILITLKIE